jgi:glutaredoxin
MTPRMRARRTVGARHARGRSFVVVLLLVAIGGAVYANLRKLQPAQPVAGTTAPAAKPPGKVIMYSAPECEPCDRARTWMTQQGIAFEDRDVESWPPYRHELEALGSRIVPVILVDGQPQFGFFPAYIEAALRGEPVDSG